VPPKLDHWEERHEPTARGRRFCRHTCPHGGIASGAGTAARPGRRGQVGPAYASPPKWVLVTTRDQCWIRPGPTVWPYTQLGRGGRFQFRLKPFPQHLNVLEGRLIAGCYRGILPMLAGSVRGGLRGNRLSRTAMNLPSLPSLDRRQQQAVRNEQPHQEAASSWLESSPLPQSVALGRLFDGSRPPIAPASPRSKPQEALPPIPSRSPLWFAVVFGSGPFERHYHPALPPYI